MDSARRGVWLLLGILVLGAGGDMTAEAQDTYARERARMVEHIAMLVLDELGDIGVTADVPRRGLVDTPVRVHVEAGR